MPRGQQFTKEKWSQLGREGGRVSGMVKQERVLGRYMEIVKEKGVFEALKMCRAESWKNGYSTCYHHLRSKI